MLTAPSLNLSDKQKQNPFMRMLSKLFFYRQKHVRFYGHVGNMVVFFNAIYFFKAHFERVIIVELNYRF